MAPGAFMSDAFATAKPIPARVRFLALGAGLLAIALATTTTISSLAWIGRTFSRRGCCRGRCRRRRRSRAHSSASAPRARSSC